MAIFNSYVSLPEGTAVGFTEPEKTDGKLGNLFKIYGNFMESLAVWKHFSIYRITGLADFLHSHYCTNIPHLSLIESLGSKIHSISSFLRFSELPSGKRLYNELERSTILNGKIHYFYGHFQ